MSNEISAINVGETVYGLKDAVARGPRVTFKIFDGEPVKADLSVVKLSVDEYAELVVASAEVSNCLYIVHGENVDAYGERVVNVARPVDPDDAATKGYVDGAVPTDLSAFTNSPGYTANAGTITGITMNGASMGTSGNVDLGTVLTAHQSLSDYYRKSETSGAAEVSAALDGKADSAALAPDWDPTKAYLQGEHVTYLGKMYECVLSMSAASDTEPDADTTHWKLTDLAAPDATLDLLSDGRLRLVAADGQALWAQGYGLASASSTALSCGSVNLLLVPAVSAFSESAGYAAGDMVTYDGALYSFVSAHAAGSWDSGQAEEIEAWTHVLTMPDPPSGGKVGDFVLDVDNSANAAGGGADAKLSLTGMFTAFSLVVEAGGNIEDVLTVAAGEMAELYFTLTAFKLDSLPTWKVSKQTVENAVPPEVAP